MRHSISTAFTAALALALVTVTVPGVLSPATGSPASPAASPVPVGADSECTPHPPIQITEDEGPRGFVLAQDPTTGEALYRPGSGVTAGSGTPADPYVIEGWCIQAIGSAGTEESSAGVAEAGLAIEGTSAHVLVRDNVVAPPEHEAPGTEVTPAAHGVHVRDAANVRIEANTLQGAGQQGLLLEGTDDVSVRDNDVHDNTARAGIHLDGAHGTEVQANEIHGNVDFDDLAFAQAGVLLHDASQNVIAGNAIHDNREAGVILSGASQENLLADNTIEDNHGEGIAVGHEPFHASEDNTIAGNHVRDERGITVRSSSHGATITANTIQALGGQRGVMVTADGVTIEDNRVEDARAAIRVDGDGARIVANELVASARAGIQLSYAAQAHVADNTIEEGGGVLLQGFEASDFDHEIAASNTLDGRPIVHVHDARDRHVTEDAAQVLVTRSANVTVADQATQGAVVGVYVAHSTNVTVQDSAFADSAWHGIKAEYGSGLRVENVSVDASGSDGIEVRRTDNVSVEDASVRDSDRYGVHLYDAPDSSVEATTIRGSQYEGLRFWLSPSPLVNDTIADDNGRLGIRVASGDGALVTNSTARDNGNRGIVVSGSQGTEIRANEALRNGEEGIRLGSAPDAELRANNLAANGVGVAQWNSEPVDARHNWWGCEQGPQDAACDDADDGVSYDPWLTSPNPEAGAGR